MWKIFNVIKIFPIGFCTHINLKQITWYSAMKNEIFPSGLPLNILNYLKLIARQNILILSVVCGTFFLPETYIFYPFPAPHTMVCPALEIKQQVTMTLMTLWESIRRIKGSVALCDFFLKSLGVFVCASLLIAEAFYSLSWASFLNLA